MKRFTPMMAAALLCTTFSAGVLAQTQTATPSKSDTMQAAGKSTARHASNAMAKKTSLASGQVRNWKAIDKNHDNLIEPAEMEAYLNQGKSAAKK